MATVYFSEGMYKNDDATGVLDASSLSVALEGAGDLEISEYSVTHSAGDNSAEVSLTLSKEEASGEETLKVEVTQAAAYDEDGNPVEAGSASDKLAKMVVEEKEWPYMTAYVEGGHGTLPGDYKDQLEAHFNDNNNVVDTTGMLADMSYGDILTTIVPNSGEAQDGVAPTDSWFDDVSYQGAFEPGGNNWATWTLTYGMEDYKNDNSWSYSANDTVIKSGEITSDETWSNTTLYKLDGFVFITGDAKLTIEAGTMVQGLPGQGENASALIVARDGSIQAEGSAEKPIVFTGDGDTYIGDNFTTSATGTWGGVLVLGTAPTNNPTQDHQMEGIPSDQGYPSLYGGNNPDHNAGTVKYISIRHGGTNIGAGNEINGFTLGAVGSETTIDYIEVISNVDDGVEWFGGTVNTKHLFTAYCGDDSYDYDEGFQGKGQFWVTIQADGRGDRLGEHDSGGDGEGTTPYSMPTIYNATYVGHGGNLITFRDDAGGTYANSIFFNTSGGIELEYRDDQHDTWSQFAEEGNLVIKNNIFKDVAQ
jgi:hypothetical protein